MALQVWLPLNGNLNNQGLSNVNITNNGATVDNNGKIGKCYKVTNSTKFTIATQLWMAINESNSLSISMWIKYQGSSSYVIACNSYEIYFNSSTLGWRLGNGSGHTLNTYVSGTYAENTWHHLTCTWDCVNKILSTYINGLLMKSVVDTSTSAYNSILSVLSFSYSNTYYLNDLRIYDHCLSPKEVKEISKGLILHYKLDDYLITNLNPYTLSTDNYIISDYLNRTHGIIANEVYHVDGYQLSSYIDTSFSASTKGYIILLPDTDYYLSFYCKVENSAIDIFFGTSGQAYTSLIDSNAHKYYPVKNVTLGKNYSGFVSLLIHTGSDTQYKINLGFDSPNFYGIGSYMEFSQVMISLQKPLYYIPYENYNIIYDSSGYCNHGSITETLTTNGDSPRYTNSIVFDGSNSIIKGTLQLSNDYKYTASFWVKPTSFGLTRWIFAVASGSNHLLGCYLNGDINTLVGGIVGSSSTVWSAGLLTNILYHIVITSDGTNVKVYKNGELLGTNTKNGTTTGTTFWIGLRPGAAGSYNYHGILSDFRIYCTALSENDIKELYNTSALIDNKGNINCFLAVESNYETNILDLAQQSLTKKTWGNGLFNDSSLSKAVVTLTDTGLRVYREPNNTSTSSGSGEGKQNNWGGFVLRNTDNVFGLLDGHTYLILVDVKGKSDTAMVDNGWRHHVGWNYSNTGIAPAPTNIRMLNPVNATFNSDNWVLVSYKFTISDTVYKVATSTYLYHTQGETYLAYYQFKLGWTYSTTGAVGTDVYFNNLRMFDITYNTPKELNVNKQGIIEAFSFTENGDNAFIDRYSSSNSNQLIEI